MMLTVSEARARILASIQPLGTEAVPLAEACGRVLARAVTASEDLPLFDNSSVDGFALTADDAASRRILKVVADLPAGDVPQIRLQPGQAARVMTGAALPEGTAAVVMVEDTDFQDRRPGTPAPARVRPQRRLRAGENVRRKGDDLHAGDCLLTAPKILRAQEVGLLAMLGQDPVEVHLRPRLGLLSTGDELQPPGERLRPGKVREANSFTLAALAASSGAEVRRLGTARDDPEDIRARLAGAVQAGVDVLLTTAGVSVGAFDFLKSVIEQDGRLEFWQINMRPGKPLAFGSYQGVPVFGLPGNPVSAFVGFEVFVRPALRRLTGLGGEPPALQTGRLAEPVESDGRESYLRVLVEEVEGIRWARLAGHQGSGNLLSLVRANALLIVPSGVKSLPANTDVELWPLD